jgi:hypothetical protein
MSTFSPSEAALEGFRLTRERVGSVLAWAGVYFLGILVISAIIAKGLPPEFLELVRSEGVRDGDLEALRALGQTLAPSWPLFVVAFVIVVSVMAIVTGGIYRLILRPEEKGFAHLRVGPDELRLLAAHLLMLGLGLAALVVCNLIMALLIQAVGAGPIVSLIGLALVLAMIWIGVRLSLTTPLAFHERRVSLVAAWRLTHGRFWPMLGMILLSWIFYLMVWALLLVIDFVFATLGGVRGDAVSAMTNPSLGTLVAMAVVIFIQLMLPVLQIIMFFAPFAVAYRQISEAEAR